MRYPKIISLLTALLLLPSIIAGMAFAQDISPRPPSEILPPAGESPSPDMIRELFINCSEWDEAHSPFQEESRQALIDLGSLAVPTLLEGWLASVDIRRRVELDTIVREVGSDSAQFLIPYLESNDPYTRRHAAYLLGDTAAIGESENPLALGPHENDLPAMQALSDALESETDWTVMQSIIGAMGYMRDPSLIDTIRVYLTHDEEALRLSAAISLGRIPHQDIIHPLMSAFSNEIGTVRMAAVLALSTKTNGNLSFEALNGACIQPSGASHARLCALETLRRYMENISTIHEKNADDQRLRCYSTAESVLTNETNRPGWNVRAYAVELMGWTYNEEAVSFLQEYTATEDHPLVIGKINEALERLMEGQPPEISESD